MECKTSLTWSARLVARTGVEPVWVGVLVAVGLAAVPWAIEGAEGHVALVFSGELPTINLRAPTVAMALIGLAPAAQLYLTRWTARHVEEIAALIPGARHMAPPAHPNVWPGFLGALALALLFLVPMADWDGYRTGNAFTLHGLYSWPMVLVLGWCIGRFLDSLLRNSLQVSRLAAQLPAVDLLDPQPLRPFVQQGLRGALLMVLLLTLTAVLAVSPGRAMVGSLLVMLASILVAIIALLLPARGVHDRLRAEKRRQLSQLRTQIDAVRRTMIDGVAAPDDAARLPGLLALETRIETAREWPFDTNALSRFALYLLLGLGSWVGAAAVEYLLDWSLAGP